MAVALERQHAAAPGYAAALTDEADFRFPAPRRPRDKHRRHTIRIGEQELRGVFDVVGVVAQPSGPGADGLRQSADVQQLVDQVRAVIEQHAAPSIRLPAPPRDGGVSSARIGGQTIHPELREIPAADHAVVEPLPHAAPHRIEPVLMAGHHHPSRIERRGREGRCLGAVHRHRLLAQDVIALRQRPERQTQMRRGRRADVDEVERSQIGELRRTREEGNPLK